LISDPLLAQEGNCLRTGVNKSVALCHVLFSAILNTWEKSRWMAASMALSR
jgi:hypothetical protein